MDSKFRLILIESESTDGEILQTREEVGTELEIRVFDGLDALTK